MANAFQLAGAQPQKNPRYVPLYTSRFWSGLVTNRSPLRSAGSAYEERYLGTRGDALIDGSNCEITPRLTLARRPGNPVYNSNSFTGVDAFYSFREFSSTTEQIRVMVDDSVALYDGTANVKTLVWTKSSGAGQSFMQSVGNNLFFANGVDQKKWVQSLFTRNASGALPNIANSTTLRAVTTPFLSTYLVDSNNNLQQLLATKLTTISNVAYVSATNTLTLTVASTAGMSAGDLQICWGLATATWLNGITINVISAAATTVTAHLVNENHADYPSAADTGTLAIADGGSPVTGGSVPTWSTTVPAAANNYQGGITTDGTALWLNKGNPVENWGIAQTTTAPSVAVGSSTSAWHANTFYSFAGVIIDTNGNIQQVTTAGLAGSSVPTWSTTLGATTTDGTVVWTLIQTAASLTWQAHTQYGPATITSFSITTNVVTVICANNFKTNQTILISGLAVGTYLNGRYLLITAASSTQFTAAFTHANVGATPDSGTATPGTFLINNASGTNCLFKLSTPIATPYLTGTINVTGWNSDVSFDKFFPAPPGDFSFTSASLNWTGTHDGNTMINTLNGAGETTGTTDTGHHNHWEAAIVGNIHIRVAGQYSFNLNHDDGAFWAFGGTAQKISGIFVEGSGFASSPHTQTAVQGYTQITGNNGSGAFPVNASVWNFPTAGDYPYEIDWANWKDQSVMILTANGQQICPTPDESGAISPVWPAWSTSFAPNYPNVKEAAGQYVWLNLGPTADYVWTASINYTLPNTSITDTNNNTEAPYRTGVSGTTIPTFATGLNQLTNDNPNLIWINKGPASAPAPGTISAFNGGYQYAIALVNSATNTVSNATQLSVTTGNFIGAAGVSISGGLPALASIDPQSDYVAIFRTTDGFTTPFLIPGTGNSIYTIPLSTYIQDGYNDTASDTELNNLIQAAVNGENTPPANGAKNLTYHLSRIFFSIGNTVYWTSGPDTPVGNGVEGVAPSNTQVFPSLVTRVVPTTVGAFVFTVSDIYIIVGQGTTTSPIQPAYPYLKGIGLLNYNALEINGSDIGFYSSDKRFIVLNPSSGPSNIGFFISDKLQASSWNGSNVYVTWHASGEDNAWFVADGSTGWYRVSPTPAPEQGITWSPFATIVGGAKAVQSIETSPGVHKLLVGPTGTGSILNRDLTNWRDGTSTYTWFATVGSHVLASPGQLAEVAFLATDCVATGTRPSISVLLNEAFPYYTGPFEALNFPSPDPPQLTESKSIYGQRFYLSESGQPAVCRSMQWKIEFPAENFQNELLSATLFGAILVEI